MTVLDNGTVFVSPRETGLALDQVKTSDAATIFLSPREQFILRYLRDGTFMEATERMMGEAMVMSGHIYSKNQPYRIARGVVMSLRRKGFAYRIPELRAWRITIAGRHAAKTL